MLLHRSACCCLKVSLEKLHFARRYELLAAVVLILICCDFTSQYQELIPPPQSPNLCIFTLDGKTCQGKSKTASLFKWLKIEYWFKAFASSVGRRLKMRRVSWDAASPFQKAARIINRFFYSNFIQAPSKHQCSHCILHNAPWAYKSRMWSVFCLKTGNKREQQKCWGCCCGLIMQDLVFSTLLLSWRVHAFAYSTTSQPMRGACLFATFIKTRPLFVPLVYPLSKEFCDKKAD